MKIMKIEDAMIKNVVTLQSDVSAYDAVKIMNENKIGCLVVLLYSFLLCVRLVRFVSVRILTRVHLSYL
jgi:predicted transcriptional regulator